MKVFVSFVTDEDLHGRNVLRIELWLPRVTKLMKTFVVKTVLQVLAMRMLTIINLNSSLLGGRPYYTCHTSLLHEYLFLYSLISLAMYTYTFGFSFEALLTQIVSGARVAAILYDGAVPLPPVHQCTSFTHSRSGHSSDLARMTMEYIGLLVHGVCWLPTVCGLIELLQCANCTCLCNSMLRYNCI